MCTLIILLSALTKSQKENPKFGISVFSEIPNLGILKTRKSQIWDFRNPKFGISEITEIPNLGFSFWDCEQIPKINPKRKSQKKSQKKSQTDFTQVVGGDFGWSATSWEAILTGKSPQIACFRACGAPWDADSGWSRAPCVGFFLPKVVVFGVRRGTITSSCFNNVFS